MLAAKVGIKSCRGAIERISFVHIIMYVATQLLLVSLLFIAILTPLFNPIFFNNLVCLAFIAYCSMA